MTRTAASPILHLIRRVVEDQRLKGLPDHDLLRCFLTAHDKAAFDALLRRHGSMVLDVCRNVLGNEQDAEDAFQATFLVLAQKAGAIRKASSVGSWLYGVAYRTASQARLRSARRQHHEARSRRTTVAPDDFTWREVQQLLHAELNRMPECYRAPLVHCYLEGKTQDEAARLLGVSKATIKKRLEAGRALLRTRLVRQGLGPAAVLAISAWPSATASAAIPFVLLDSTVKAAVLIGAGEAVKGVIAPKVLALTEGVLKAMFLTKLKMISAVVLTVVVCAGVLGWSYQVTAAQTGPQGPTFQPPQQGRQEPPYREEPAARPPRRAQGAVADELDALRLEIEALRKDFKAMRERVKLLEAEARGRKELGAGLNQIQQVAPAGGLVDMVITLPATQAITLPATQLTQLGRVSSDVAPTLSGMPGVQDGKLVLTEPPADYLAEAEAALKKLRQNPHDNQAAELLDKATQRLKAQAKGEDKANRASDNTPARQH